MASAHISVLFVVFEVTANRRARSAFWLGIGFTEYHAAPENIPRGSCSRASTGLRTASKSCTLRRPSSPPIWLALQVQPSPKS